MNNPADTANRPEAGPGYAPVDGTATEMSGRPPQGPVRGRGPAMPGGERIHPDDGAVEVIDPDRRTILEMRQVAGLTAGSIMDLHAGSFQFRESDKDVGFSLLVRGPNDVVVVPGTATTMVDEIVIDEPTPLGDSILNVGTACFTVRRPRPDPTPDYRLAVLEEARRSPRALVVPDLPMDQAGSQTRSSRFGSLFSRPDNGPDAAFDEDCWNFLESIRDLRSSVAERHRHLHPDPEEQRSRLNRLDPGLWDRTIEHSLFARFAVAYATIPWEPRFDAPERIPTQLHDPIREMSCLPWVPITANLLFGPLGIVGTRPAVLAAARNAVLSLACLSSPSDIEFSIVTAQGLVEDWSWTSALPNSLFPTGGNAYCVAVADGMVHFDGAGLDHEAVQHNEMGLIVLGETLDELPDYCGTILQITPEGRCHVSNHLGEQIVATPIGVTAGFAAATAAAITDAIGDEPQSARSPAEIGPPSEIEEPVAEATPDPQPPLHADDFADKLRALFDTDPPANE